MWPTTRGCCTAWIVGGGPVPPCQHVHLSCLPASCKRLPYGYFRTFRRTPLELQAPEELSEALSCRRGIKAGGTDLG